MEAGGSSCSTVAFLFDAKERLQAMYSSQMVLCVGLVLFGITRALAFPIHTTRIWQTSFTNERRRNNQSEPALAFGCAAKSTPVGVFAVTEWKFVDIGQQIDVLLCVRRDTFLGV